MSITATIHNFALRSPLKISEQLSYFYETSFKLPERRFCNSLKPNRGYFRYPLDTVLLFSYVRLSYSSVMQHDVQRGAPTKCLPMDKNKLYLDSIATYHSMFCKWCLKNVCKTGRGLCRNCNAGATSIVAKDALGIFDVWAMGKGL